jgi:flagellar motor switch protein FliM
MDLSSPAPGTQEVLSQTEVERLLAEVAEQESATTIVKSGGEKGQKSLESIQPYDFRQPAFLSATELRKIRIRNETFIHALAARLSIYLRIEFNLQMSKLHTLPYAKFAESLSNPTHLALFKVDPLRGISLLDIPPRLGLTIVDRLLGGAAHSVNSERDLSDIESALLDQAILVILNEWCNHWSFTQDLRPALVGHENNPRFLQTATHDTVMLGLGMEARLGDCVEQIQIAIPYYTLEPLVLQMNGQGEAAQKQAGGPAAKRAWNRTLDDVRIPVVAEWEGLELTAREIARLQPGDVLQLSSQCADQVQVRLARIPKFLGRLGTCGPAWAVELTQVLKNAETNPA